MTEQGKWTHGVRAWTLMIGASVMALVVANAWWWYYGQASELDLIHGDTGGFELAQRGWEEFAFFDATDVLDPPAGFGALVVEFRITQDGADPEDFACSIALTDGERSWAPGEPGGMATLVNQRTCFTPATGEPQDVRAVFVVPDDVVDSVQLQIDVISAQARALVEVSDLAPLPQE